VAGGRAEGNLEAAAGRGVLVAGGRGQCPVHDVWQPREEIVVAADAATGKTLWEHSTPMTFQSEAPEQGNGPYSTPLIVGDACSPRVSRGACSPIDKKSGKLLWTQQLWQEHKGTRIDVRLRVQSHRLSRQR